MSDNTTKPMAYEIAAAMRDLKDAHRDYERAQERNRYDEDAHTALVDAFARFAALIKRAQP